MGFTVSCIEKYKKIKWGEKGVWSSGGNVW